VDLLTYLHSAFLSQPQPHTVEKFVAFSQQMMREHVAEAEDVVLKNGMKIPVLTRPRTKEAVAASAPRAANAGPISFVGGAARAGVSSLAGGLGTEPASVIPNAEVFPKAK
jgi:hypothetical protein